MRTLKMLCSYLCVLDNFLFKKSKHIDLEHGRNHFYLFIWERKLRLKLHVCSLKQMFTGKTGHTWGYADQNFKMKSSGKWEDCSNLI